MVELEPSPAEERLLKCVPPSSLEAERSVLGALMLDERALDLVTPIVGPRDFYSEAHANVFTALCDLKNGGRPLDVLLLKHELERRHLLEAVGGPVALAEITDSVPSSANVEHYARVVRELALRRALIQACHATARDAFERRVPTDELLDVAQRRLFELADRRRGRGSVRIQDALAELFARLEQIRAGTVTDQGIATGYPDLDKLTRGFDRGALVVLAARPSVGKTTAALNFIRHQGLAGERPHLFSLEMGVRGPTENLLCGEARVEAYRLRGGVVDAIEERELLKAAAALEPTGITFDGDPTLTCMEFRSKARRAVAEGATILYVDYLQLMTGSDPRAIREQQVSEISRTLKAVARELAVPVVALAQLSRKVEDRPDHKPKLSDLRESGSIEADADVVLLLHRPEVHKPDDENLQGLAQVLVAKNRNGPTGEVELHFMKAVMRFESNSTS